MCMRIFYLKQSDGLVSEIRTIQRCLALALHLKLPLWSNDRDFEGTGVERFTTAQLLSKLLR